ncbi:MAG: CARDB domain-containing protein [Bacteroidota bacterium]
MKRKFLIVILIIFGISFKCLAAVNLIISSGTVPSTMKPGSTYPITINVTNNGTTATTTSFYINISINTAATYTGSQTWLTDITVTGGVAAGVTKTF